MAMASKAFTYNTHPLYRELLLLLLLLPLLLHVQPLTSASSFTPPPGNSIVLRVVTLDGKLLYICEREGGEWVPWQKTATLMDRKNRTKIVGFYASNSKRNHNSTHVGTWTMMNNGGDQAESGRPTSLVSGKQVAGKQNGTKELQDFLAQASAHWYEGFARRVSYISQMNAKIMVKLPSSKCEVHKGILSIMFKANYVFWKQDLLPPRVPTSLSVPSDNQPVESFFAQGVIRYVYDKKVQSWRKRKALARLYDVAGGALMGGFTYHMTLSNLASSSHPQDSDGLACITINDPNGFQVCGREHVTPVIMSQSSLPWSLFNITTNIGNVTRTVGPFSYSHLVSTWGGLPPQDANIADLDPSFQVWRSSFTAILWLYAKTTA